LFYNYIRLATPNFKGEGFSYFRFLPGPQPARRTGRHLEHEYRAVGTHFQPAGTFQGSLETVKATLRDYPLIEYHTGLIPKSFASAAERIYKFVHLDLDEPIKGAVEYFYPRMVKGGVIDIDEYGIPRWPGARRLLTSFVMSIA
jgi:hypothetical protein